MKIEAKKIMMSDENDGKLYENFVGEDNKFFVFSVFGCNWLTGDKFDLKWR